ncbi:unnamed protein product [Dibothriocephalus latus]|uniref:Fibronectin type-III domain-containing protein n=1 Tax=Dibothriocephalus latus TaxID=60516 RepID=A0A3P6PBW9_DIBLA|nr:unnamed protein product [Dibothriocephalus latus]
MDVRPIGGTYAVLRWKSEKASEIESYTLTVESKDNNLGALGQRQITNINVLENPSDEKDQRFVSYNLTDLSPYTAYTARVQAVNKKVGLSPPSDPIEFKTAEIRKCIYLCFLITLM